ncbi:MAG: efflux RND transporter periplasmic adaptor subunit [Candidatus Omnitrophica bacterium]|nr:efflux RND transporter periplasmic adaptor subunit [Candidatus Omnitrophota bacterium]
MRKIKSKIIIGVLVLSAVLAFVMIRAKGKGKSDEIVKEVTPSIGAIQTYISTTGTVLPKNRLEVKPPVNGRIESILVQEGQKVNLGQTLAWMSSTERAALLDAAEGQGEEVLKYWKEVYKPIALLAPINGEVIVATTQPGQTVTTADAVIVLSDHLIVRAQVDETDIGKIKLGQKAVIIIDAYPDDKINAVVEHIYYESETVNNVTIYKVDLLPEQVPQFFRSGMNATVDFIEQEREKALLLPVEAIYKDKDGDFVLLKKNGEIQPIRQAVQVGISDDKNTEIISGISVNDRVVVKNAKFVLPASDVGSSPFTPFGQRKNSNGKK